MAVTAITVDEFLERFPQFEGQDELIEQLIPEALLLVNDNWTTANARSGQLYAVAHMLITEGNADSLPVISESLGPMSTTYAYDPKSDPWSTTEYGRRYLAFRKNAGGGSIVVIGGPCG